MFPNLTESLDFPVIKNKTTFEETLPISLNIPKFDKLLLSASTDLKDFINSYTKHKKIFDLQESHNSDSTESNTNKNFLSDNYIVDIFMFISAVISLLAINLKCICYDKHRKLRVLIASLVL